MWQKRDISHMFLKKSFVYKVQQNTIYIYIYIYWIIRNVHYILKVSDSWDFVKSFMLWILFCFGLVWCDLVLLKIEIRWKINLHIFQK